MFHGPTSSAPFTNPLVQAVLDAGREATGTRNAKGDEVKVFDLPQSVIKRTIAGVLAAGLWIPEGLVVSRRKVYYGASGDAGPAWAMGLSHPRRRSRMIGNRPPVPHPEPPPTAATTRRRSGASSCPTARARSVASHRTGRPIAPP